MRQEKYTDFFPEKVFDHMICTRTFFAQNAALFYVGRVLRFVRALLCYKPVATESRVVYVVLIGSCRTKA